MNRRTLAYPAIACILLGAACQDLDVTNPNDPDRDRALTEPETVEALLASSWLKVWARSHNTGTAYYPLPLIGDEMTATYSNNASLELSAVPRTAFDNTSTSASHTVTRIMWLDYNQMLAAGNDVLRVIENGLAIRTGGTDNTERARAFGAFMQGLGLGHLAMMFDRAHVADETTDLENLPPYSAYPDVLAAGIAKLEEAIENAETATFTVPDTWIPGTALTSEQLARLAHTYIARLLVYSTRTPAERAAVDWQTVLAHVQAGIQEDFGINTDGFYTSFYLQRAQHATVSPQRASYRLIGPADTSGAYQAWLATPVNERTRFDIETPDRRITGPGGPTEDGTYFRYMATDAGFDPGRGTYRLSAYQWFRYGGRYNQGFIPLISLDEMRLIEAEAHYHLGNHEIAAELVNVTRVGNGELPPVTADGVPEGTGCVPRTEEGACGSLLDAIAYERMIESVGLDASRAYADRRGFGSLTSGTLLHFPVPSQELESLGIPNYTFGGVGGEWSAP